MNRTRALSVVAGLLATTATAMPLTGQQVVVTPGNLQGWSPNSVNAGSFIEINGNQPRGAAPQNTGSLAMGGTQTGATQIRARYLYNPGATLGTVGALQNFSFDWFRDASTTSDALQAPAFRLHFAANINGTTRFGELIWEWAYNDGPGGTDAGPNVNAPVGSWQSVTTGQNAGNFHVWLTGSGSVGATGCAVGGFSWQTLSSWQTSCAWMADAAIWGVSAGVGSVPGGAPQTFLGYADNIGIQFRGQNQATVFNFESQVVPEPSTYVLMGTGLLALAGVAARRRRTV